MKEMNEAFRNSCCPFCGEGEDWEHVIKCSKHKEKQDEMLKNLKRSFKKV